MSNLTMTDYQTKIIHRLQTGIIGPPYHCGGCFYIWFSEKTFRAHRGYCQVDANALNTYVKQTDAVFYHPTQTPFPTQQICSHILKTSTKLINRSGEPCLNKLPCLRHQ